MLLFLLAAGLTLIFGIMDLVNLAHGSLYMLGAYFAATFVGADRQLPGRHRAGADRDARCRHGDGGDRDPAALRPRSSRPRARHLRPADLLQRAGAADLGAGRPDDLAAVGDAHRRPGAARRLLSALSPGHHRRDARGRAAALHPGDAHADRHADPRRRVQPRDGRRARRQHQAALHAGVRARRRARGLRRHDAGAARLRADRHGREHPDPRLCRHHHRRHRLDPRRVRRRHHRRPDRHHRPRVPAGPGAPCS